MNRIQLRKLNRNIIYRTLLLKEEMSKQELAYATGLSIPTVAQNLDDLIKSGLVESSGALESTGGRRALGYKCVKNARLAIGIDITQNHITIAVVNLASEIVCISEREHFRYEDNEKCYRGILEKITQLLKKNGIDNDSILGVGVSLPCIIDERSEKVIYSRVIDAPEDIKKKMGIIESTESEKDIKIRIAKTKDELIKMKRNVDNIIFCRLQKELKRNNQILLNKEMNNSEEILLMRALTQLNIIPIILNNTKDEKEENEKHLFFLLSKNKAKNFKVKVDPILFWKSFLKFKDLKSK